jgi:hypothetical protein
MRWPSGEAAGIVASADAGVIACRPEPLALIAQTCEFPPVPLVLEKTIRPLGAPAAAPAAATPVSAATERTLITMGFFSTGVKEPSRTCSNLRRYSAVSIWAFCSFPE